MLPFKLNQESVTASMSVYVKTSVTVCLALIKLDNIKIQCIYLNSVLFANVFGSSNDGTQCQCATQ